MNHAHNKAPLGYVLAVNDQAALICGESDTGKKLVTLTIHAMTNAT
ncbi:MAG: hypothetical protein MK171_09690 [Pirellulales bacterium]|nr:hypothetical protein [Pirellulales bacterium]